MCDNWDVVPLVSWTKISTKEIQPMQLFENKLAIASLLLGVLAVGCFVLFGPQIAFIYLGIPAIVTGAILLSRIRKRKDKAKIVALCEAILGIVLGVLPLAFIFLAI
jgi:uncharacterized membrane protein HdeD (DUF308 family)